jgi:hypothetical protein
MLVAPPCFADAHVIDKLESVKCARFDNSGQNFGMAL